MKNVLYELKGASLAAAHSIDHLLMIAVEKYKPQNTGNLAEIRKSWDEFYEIFMEEISQTEPELLDHIGLTTAAITVQSEKDALPRAYKEHPLVFASPEKRPRYFMYSPVDYKGQHFKPEDGQKITGKDEQAIGELLFAGGWLGNSPLISPAVRGVALPQDYQLHSNPKSLTEEFKHTRPTATYRVFTLQGRAQDLITDFQTRKDENEAAMTSVFDAIKEACAETFPEMKIEKPDLYVNQSGSYGTADRAASFSFSLRRMSLGGERVAMTDTPYFFYEKSEGEYQITPRLDNAKGLAFAEKLYAVKTAPSLGDYPELLADFDFTPTDIESMIGVNGVEPQLRELSGLNLLVYNSDDKVSSSFCPPGGVPVSTALYHWLRHDEEDRNTGRTPPPMPSILLEELVSLSPIPKTKSLGAPQP